MQKYQYANDQEGYTHLNELLNSDVNQDQLMSSNRYLNPYEKELEQSALKRASQIVMDKNYSNQQALKQSQLHLQNKKEKMKKYYEDFISTIDNENNNLKVQLDQLKKTQKEQNQLEENYYKMKLQYDQALSQQGSNVDLKNLQSTLQDLQSEKLKLIDMLEIEKEKLNELHRTYQNEHVEYETQEDKILQKEIQELKHQISQKQIPIVKEVIVEKEAPQQTQIEYEDTYEDKEVNVKVVPSYTYQATCNCGCKCHRTPQYKTSYVRINPQSQSQYTVYQSVQQPVRTSVYRTTRLPSFSRKIIRNSYNDFTTRYSTQRGRFQ